jgi:hypothetical protein
MTEQAAKFTKGALRYVAALGGLMWWCSPLPVRAVSFNFFCESDPTCSSFNLSALSGFQQAAGLWTQLFSDDMMVRIEIAFKPLDGSILGGASAALNIAPYSGYRAVLDSDRTSVFDDLALSSLPAQSSFPLLINRTSDHPSEAGSASPYLDNDQGANNASIVLSTANVKALGVNPVYDGTSNPEGVDGWITFNSAFSWDFDRANGIAGGLYDFVGVAAHEIGHVMGFLSGVDDLDDTSSGPSFNSENDYTYVQPLDLYRYSIESKEAGAIDWTADARSKYFSIDGGVNNLADFSTGVTHGDGRQASHWKDNLGNGLMDPTFASGEQGAITSFDVLAFDVIGYDRRELNEQVPAPLPLAGSLAAVAWARRLRRRARAGG